VVTRLQFEFFGNDGHLRSKQLLPMEFAFVEKDHLNPWREMRDSVFSNSIGNNDRSPFDAIGSPVMIWVLQK